MSESTEGQFRGLGAVFGRGGERYDRLRPSYPADAAAWLVEGIRSGAPVADVGAGTGKFTAALLERDLDVTAIDPSCDMLAQLRKRHPQVRTHVGSGEETGLADASVEFVSFAQSWHWVDPVAGAAELGRTLASEGTVGMLWNFLDPRVDWVAELAAIWHTLSGAESVHAKHHDLELGPGFSGPESLSVDWIDLVPIADLADMVTTRSYYLSASTAERAAVRHQVAGLLTKRFDEAQVVHVPYQTHCYRFRRTPDASARTSC